MKRFIVLISICFVVTQVSAQLSKYVYSCGSDSSLIVCEQHYQDGLTYLTTTQGSEIHSYVFGADLQTILWRYSNLDENIQVETTLENEIYHIKGKINFKPYSKKIKSKGKFWYQHIGFVIGNLIKDDVNIRYECIRPDNLELYEMQADKKEITQYGEVKVLHIYTHLTGFLAKFFGSHYFINVATGQFLKYEGVHGAPGTPKTIITLEK